MPATGMIARGGHSAVTERPTGDFPSQRRSRGQNPGCVAEQTRRPAASGDCGRSRERGAAASGLSDRGPDTPAVNCTATGAAEGATGADGRVDEHADRHSGSVNGQRRRARRRPGLLVGVAATAWHIARGGSQASSCEPELRRNLNAGRAAGFSPHPGGRAKKKPVIPRRRSGRRIYSHVLDARARQPHSGFFTPSQSVKIRGASVRSPCQASLF